MNPPIDKYIKRLASHSIIFGFGEALIKLSGFILIPLYTRVLTRDQYGVYQIMLVASAVLSILSQYGISAALFKTILHPVDKNENDAVRAYTTAFIFLLASTVVFCCIILPFSPLLSRFMLHGTQGYSVDVFLLLAAGVIKNLPLVAMTKLRIEKRSAAFVVMSAGKFTAQTLLTILFTVAFQWGIRGIVYADLAASILHVIIALPLLPVLRLKMVDAACLKTMLRFGLPFVPAGIAMFMINLSNRLFLNHNFSLASVALFSIAYNVSFIVYMTVNAFQKIWASAMFEIHAEDNSETIYRRVLSYYLLLLCSLVFMITLFSKDLITTLASEGYFFDSSLVGLIASAYIFYGLYYYLSYGMNLHSKTGYQPLIVLTAAGVSLAGNFLLIPKFGLMGAAAANLAAFIVMGCGAGYFSNKYEPIGINFPVFIFAFAGLGAGIYGTHWIDANLEQNALPVKIAVVLAVGISVLAGYRTGWLRKICV